MSSCHRNSNGNVIAAFPEVGKLWAQAGQSPDGLRAALTGTSAAMAKLNYGNYGDSLLIRPTSVALPMARIARLVVPGFAHHVTQRGNRRDRVFFDDDDYRAYLDLLKIYAPKSGSKLIAWCLMPNHVHLLAIPETPDSLRALLGETHRRYTARINARNKWTGHLWQGRFGSVAMDEDHLAHAGRYVSLNPVRACLVAKAEDWPWSSVRAHLDRTADGLTDLAPILDRFPNFADLLGTQEDEAATNALRLSETSGRQLGPKAWIDQLEAKTGRILRPQRRGPKPTIK